MKLEYEETYFKLFNQIFLVNGTKRNLIMDTQRGEMFEINNSLYEIVEQSKTNTISEIAKLNNIEEELVAGAFDFLIEKDLGLMTSRKELLADPILEFHSPNPIENCIIVLDKIDLISIQGIIEGIKNLRVRFLELRFYGNLRIDIFHAILSQVENTFVRGVICYAEYSAETENIDINGYPHLQKLIFHNSEAHSKNGDQIVFLKQKINSNLCCGNIGRFNMENKYMVYLESLHHNSCLNRKISIDIDGNIKNCPSMKEDFGNIQDTSLTEAYEKPGFKKLWDVNKDKIHVCKECEFRYVCTDCRAYVEDPEDIFSKPLKCGYNPYTAEWDEWSSNPLKQKSIEYYGMTEMLELERKNSES